MDNNLKSFMCEYLSKYKTDNKFTYQDFKGQLKEDGYPLTDAQLSAIFNNKGKGVSIDVVERIYKSIGIVYVLNIYEEDGV